MLSIKFHVRISLILLRRNMNNHWVHLKKVSSLLFFSIALIVMISCNKKDVVPVQSSPLLGSWTLVSIETSGCTDPLDNEPATNCNNCPTLVFTETTVTTIDGTSSKKSSYTVVGNMINNSIIFTIVGPKLTLTTKGTADNGNCQMDQVYKLNG